MEITSVKYSFQKLVAFIMTLKKNKLLFIGSFGGKSKIVNGGQTFACKQFIENDFLKSDNQFILIDNLSSEKTSRFLFFDKLKNVLSRFSLLIYYLTTEKFNIAIIYTSESFAFYEKGFYVLLLKFCGKKVVFSPRSGLMIEWLEKPVAHKFASFVFKHCDIILAQGEFWHTFYSRQFNIKKSKMRILRNFIHFDDLLNTKKPSIQSGINLIFLGWIHEKKGVMKILEFINYSRNRLNIKLKICGEGDYEEQCRSYCNLNNLNEFVEFCGWVSGDVKQKLLNDSHFIFLLSDTEGLPNSILEGMKHGNIPIVTNVGSLNELVTIDSGHITNEVNYESIFKFIEGFVNNPVSYERISELNKQIIKKEYSNKSFESNIVEILNSLS